MTTKRPSSPKNSSKNRGEYLLEREKIKTEIGDLESIRLSLGLSQRRICMLLLVDPSAWTRWNKTEAPPHIYQALRWLLELRKVNPQITAPNDIETRVDQLHSATQSKIRNLEDSVAILERTLAMTATVQPAASPDLTKVLELLATRVTHAAAGKTAKRKPKAKLRSMAKPRAKTKVEMKTKVKPKAKTKSNPKKARAKKPTKKKKIPNRS